MVLTKAEATVIGSSSLCGGCQVNREFTVPSQPQQPRERRHNHLADDLEHVTQQGVPLLVRIPTGTELDATRRAAGSLSITTSVISIIMYQLQLDTHVAAVGGSTHVSTNCTQVLNPRPCRLLQLQNSAQDTPNQPPRNELQQYIHTAGGRIVSYHHGPSAIRPLRGSRLRQQIRKDDLGSYAVYDLELHQQFHQQKLESV